MIRNKWNPEKRHFCELCRVWMPPTKASIASHERSAQHVNNVNSMLSGSRRKNRNTPLGAMIDHAKLEYKMVEQAALQKFNTADSYKYYAKNPEVNIVPPDPGISEPIIHEPTWSSHFDEYGKVYYYNRKTKKSTYEKPADFDGYDPTEQQDNVYLNTFNPFKATPFYVPDDKGLVGGWEEVKPEEDYFESRKVAEDDEKKKEREQEKERLKEEILNVHKGVKPEKKPETGLKLSKEGEIPKEIQEEEEEESDLEPDAKVKKVEELNEDEKQELIKKKTEHLREALSRQNIEFVGKPTYHEEIATGEKNVGFKKRPINKGKRKAPESG